MFSLLRLWWQKQKRHCIVFLDCLLINLFISWLMIQPNQCHPSYGIKRLWWQTLSCLPLARTRQWSSLATRNLLVISLLSGFCWLLHYFFQISICGAAWLSVVLCNTINCMCYGGSQMRYLLCVKFQRPWNLVLVSVKSCCCTCEVY